LPVSVWGHTTSPPAANPFRRRSIDAYLVEKEPKGKRRKGKEA